MIMFALRNQFEPNVALWFAATFEPIIYQKHGIFDNDETINTLRLKRKPMLLLVNNGVT